MYQLKKSILLDIPFSMEHNSLKKTSLNKNHTYSYYDGSISQIYVAENFFEKTKIFSEIDLNTPMFSISSKAFPFTLGFSKDKIRSFFFESDEFYFKTFPFFSLRLQTFCKYTKKRKKMLKKFKKFSNKNQKFNFKKINKKIFEKEKNLLEDVFRKKKIVSISKSKKPYSYVLKSQYRKDNSHTLGKHTSIKLLKKIKLNISLIKKLSNRFLSRKKELFLPIIKKYFLLYAYLRNQVSTLDKMIFKKNLYKKEKKKLYIKISRYRNKKNSKSYRFLSKKINQLNFLEKNVPSYVEYFKLKNAFLNITHTFEIFLFNVLNKNISTLKTHKLSFLKKNFKKKKNNRIFKTRRELRISEIFQRGSFKKIKRIYLFNLIHIFNILKKNSRKKIKSIYTVKKIPLLYNSFKTNNQKALRYISIKDNLSLNVKNKDFYLKNFKKKLPKQRRIFSLLSNHKKRFNARKVINSMYNTSKREREVNKELGKLLRKVERKKMWNYIPFVNKFEYFSKKSRSKNLKKYSKKIKIFNKNFRIKQIFSKKEKLSFLTKFYLNHLFQSKLKKNLKVLFKYKLNHINFFKKKEKYILKNIILKKIHFLNNFNSIQCIFKKKNFRKKNFYTLSSLVKFLELGFSKNNLSNSISKKKIICMDNKVYVNTLSNFRYFININKTWFRDQQKKILLHSMKHFY